VTENMPFVYPCRCSLAGMKKIGLLLLVLLPVPPRASSQTISGTAPAPVHAGSAQARVITLGNSVIALDGIWKFHPGDSPWVNGAPEWAQPGYDDSRWAALDLTPQTGSVNLELGTTGFVPGWTRKGYPELSGYAWYRLRVRVTNPGQPIWLKMPDSFDDAYEVYANGQFIGHFGDFRRNHVTIYVDQPLSFALPASPSNGEIELALRFYMSPATQFSSPDVGGMHGPPMLGLAATVRMMQVAGKDVLLHVKFGEFLQMLIYLLVAPLALWAWLYSRRERAWLWLFLLIVLAIALLSIDILTTESTLISVVAGVFWNFPLAMFALPLLVMFWWEWFGLQERRWIPRAAWLLSVAGCLTFFCYQSPVMGLDFLPQSTLHWFNAAGLLEGLAGVLLLIVILVKGFRRDRTEALLAALPISLQLFGTFSSYLLTTFHIPNMFFPFGLGIGVGDITSILMILVIGALALRRFVRTQVREGVARKAIALDLEQAQQLQQKVLVPEAGASKYFTVEAEYRPAQKVGGDFFQTLTAPDGTLLVVIGDVSGKGMSASMLVAVLVGAIRNQAEYSFDPAEMLAALNRRLLGRAGGHFATCLAVEISPDGTMRIANAGHLRPYLNGEEMDLEGSLPLGMVDEAGYTAQNFPLQPGDRLTLMTDGVVEATNAAKQLFGFERTREISRDSAAAIAARAQSFGQEDDITVVGVEFAGVAATA
jgi:Stage II sporulation protein E (SpoIIE)